MAEGGVVTTDLKRIQLRIIAAMLEEDADCVRILSRDCVDLGVDPRTHIVLKTCVRCLESIRWDKSSRDKSWEILTSNTCSDECQRYKCFRNLSLHDVAASLGHIDTLCDLPSFYTDLTSRDPSLPCTSEHPNHQHASTTAEKSDDNIRQQTLPDMLCHSKDSGNLNSDAVGRPASMCDSFQSRAAVTSEPLGDTCSTQTSGSSPEIDSPGNLFPLKSGNTSGAKLFRNISCSKSSGNTLLGDSTEDKCNTNTPGNISERSTAENISHKEKGISTESSDALSEQEKDETLTDQQKIQEQDGAETFFESLETLFQSDETTAQPPLSHVQDEDEGEPLFESLEALFHTDKTEIVDGSSPTFSQGESDGELAIDSLEALFQDEDSHASASSGSLGMSDNDSVASCASSKSSTSPHDQVQDNAVQSPVECRHANFTVCRQRRDTVESAVKKYLQHGFGVENLVKVLHCQPCSEDVIDVFNLLNELPETKNGSLDLGPLIKEFGGTKGAHTGATPLMSACRHVNEVVMQKLLEEKMVDVSVPDKHDLTAVEHLFHWWYREEYEGESLVRKRMAKQLKLHRSGRSQTDLHHTPRDFFHLVPSLQNECSDKGDNNQHLRKKQSKLCQLAWRPFKKSQTELQDLVELFDQEITFRCCRGPCGIFLFPDVAVQCSDPTIIFSTDFEDNEELFLSIERGKCPCTTGTGLLTRFSISFLPVCAAAAARNDKLFRWMVQSYTDRVLNFRRDSESVTGKSTRSRLKGSISGAEKGKSARKIRIRFDTTLTTFHSDRLLAQALRHVLYAGPASKALHVLDDRKVKDVFTLTGESRMSLVDMALRVGDETTFMDLLDRFGLDVQSELDGMTPLLVAVSWGNIPLARRLLQRGVRRGAEDRYGRNAVEIALKWKSSTGSDEIALMLLKEGEGHLDPEDPRIPSTLESAIRVERYTVIDYLLQQGQVTVPQRDKGNLVWSPVVAWCCRSRLDLAVAGHLVQKGLDCHSPLALAPGMTPLQSCVSLGSLEALSLIDALIERGADLNEKTPQGLTPLAEAVKSRNCKIFCKLVAAGAILDSPTRLGGVEMDRLAPINVKQGSSLWQALNTKQYKLAKMIMAAGYRAHVEPWYINGDFPEHTPQDVMETLEKISQEPLSLISICRRGLRETVNRDLPGFLAKAGLPQSVVDFILMKDLLDDYLTEVEPKYKRST